MPVVRGWLAGWLVGGPECGCECGGGGWRVVQRCGVAVSAQHFFSQGLLHVFRARQFVGLSQGCGPRACCVLVWWWSGGGVVVVVAMMVFVEAEVLACLLGRQQGCFKRCASAKQRRAQGWHACGCSSVVV